MIKETLDKRLAELKSEYQKGIERLNQLEQEVTSVKETLLRITGAIQVLEELMTNNEEQKAGSDK